MRILNLYAGLGGNRKHWNNCDVPKRELWDKMQAFRNGLEWSTK